MNSGPPAGAITWFGRWAAVSLEAFGLLRHVNWSIVADEQSANTMMEEAAWRPGVIVHRQVRLSHAYETAVVRGNEWQWCVMDVAAGEGLLHELERSRLLRNASRDLLFSVCFEKVLPVARLIQDGDDPTDFSKSAGGSQSRLAVVRTLFLALQPYHHDQTDLLLARCIAFAEFISTGYPAEFTQIQTDDRRRLVAELVTARKPS